MCADRSRFKVLSSEGGAVRPVARRQWECVRGTELLGGPWLVARGGGVGHARPEVLGESRSLGRTTLSTGG